MAWTAPRTWSACEVVTAAIMNTHVRDNLNQTFPALVTTAGDSVWATGANAGQRVAVGATGTLIAANSGCNAGVAWDALLTIGGSSGSHLMIGISGAACAAVHVRGFGPATVCPLTTGCMDAAVIIIDNSGAVNNGGALYFGTGTAPDAGFKFLSQDVTTCSVGHLSVVLRASVNSACLTEVARFVNTGAPTGQMLIGATACNSKMTAGGLTIKTTAPAGTGTGEAIAIKSANYTAHGMTSLDEPDTFFSLAPTGQAAILAYSASEYGNTVAPFIVNAYSGGAADTSKAASSVGVMMLISAVQSGTSSSRVSASGNLLLIANGASARFIFEGDGAAYEHVGTAWTNFDDHDDLALLNMTAAHLSRDPIREGFTDWLKTNRQQLQDLNLVVFNEDGGHFVNRSRMQELLIGAVRQMGDRNRQLETRVVQLEQRLLSPPSMSTA
jgi:hypothetical protein